MAYADIGDLAHAESDFRDAIESQNAAVSAAPEIAMYRIYLGNHWLNAAKAKERQEKLTDAAAAYKMAAENYTLAGDTDRAAEMVRFAHRTTSGLKPGD